MCNSIPNFATYSAIARLALSIPPVGMTFAAIIKNGVVSAITYIWKLRCMTEL